MSNNKELFISYLDESKIENIPGQSARYYSIASMTASKSEYIEKIEQKWADLRKAFRIQNGMVMHFTDIKHLLNTAPSRPHKAEWVKIFSDGGQINYPKLYKFYREILHIIDESPFVVMLTGVKWEPDHTIRGLKKNKNLREQTYFTPYIAFREHLNLMSFYLLNLLNSTDSISYNRITKLRYDGDVGLGERDDIKEAYHHAITLGTRHFRPSIVKSLFDEIRFIGKNEVGSENITHAGNEIIDFITTIASRDMWSLEQEKIPLVVPGHEPIYPLAVIKKKIIKKQMFDDIYF
ncbi:hypothetical protein [Brevibacillus halotolerans]|uniref:hypothetical protein n=1 Tax=Brevibacillus halotolerans TaxID=1507437 RepID=UPI0015EFAA04|nr:hypothetical protein [Brevibacillus halotolerans]MBA4535542.1 hypothetical protein [Brevibacillus halotolerans]